MSTVTALLKGVSATLLNALTTGNGTRFAVGQGITNIVIYIQGDGTVSGGTVTIKTATQQDYTGTWAAFGAAITVVGSGAQVVVNIPAPIAFGAITVDISANITGGGTVTVTAIGR